MTIKKSHGYHPASFVYAVKRHLGDDTDNWNDWF